MDKDTRGLIADATQRARSLLEREFSEQLEGTYDILPDGRIPTDPGQHLDDHGKVLRAKLVAAVRYRQAGGLSSKDAVDATVREAAFTTLNRFVALKMLEARGMVQECVSKGDLSAGFREYGGLAPGLADLPDKGYRLYLESLFDEIGREVHVLFDRRDVAGTLWPRRVALGELLDVLNDAALADIWRQDETIGWVYQYFNGEDERRKMRDESQAPRNSRELAVRNQFFTPRYVVEFLTDNTLGRTWYEMRGGQTALADACRYLVRRYDEVFLSEMSVSDRVTRDAVAPLLDDTVPFPTFITGDEESADRLIMLAHAVNGYHRHPLDHPTMGGEEWMLDVRAHLEHGEPLAAFKTQDLLDVLFLTARAERMAGGYGLQRDPLAFAIGEEIHRRVLHSREPDLTQKERLRAPSFVPFRAKKDPRDLKILDPACGSGHFLLYCFDLLLTIYIEGWADESAPPSKVTGTTLRADYPTRETFDAALPGLIVRHNLHGIDIDPRATQIAELALWMRAGRAVSELNVPRADRVPIRKTNIVVAEPMPGDRLMLDEFLRGVDPRLHSLMRLVWDRMQLAGEAGSLLRIEREIANGIRLAREERLVDEPPVQGTFYAQDQRPVQRVLTGSVEERRFWNTAEAAILTTLREFAARATGDAGMGRRLFAENAAQGFAFVDLCQQKYDVLLMNPPFGAAPEAVYQLLVSQYPLAYSDLAAMFLSLSDRFCTSSGLLGSISTRAYMQSADLAEFRQHVAIPNTHIIVDLGAGVMDGAWVESSMQVSSMRAASKAFLVCDRRRSSSHDKERVLDFESHGTNTNEKNYLVRREQFNSIPAYRIAYDAQDLLGLIASPRPLAPDIILSTTGLRTFDDDRFYRLRWEVDPSTVDANRTWIGIVKNTEFAAYYYPYHVLVKWQDNGKELAAKNYEVNGQTAQARQGSRYYFKAGLAFSRRSEPTFSAKIHPADCAFSSNGGVILPKGTASPYYLCGLLNSTLFRSAVRLLANKYSYTSGHIEVLAWKQPSHENEQIVSHAAGEAIALKISLERQSETDPYYLGVPGVPNYRGLKEYCGAEIQRRLRTASRLAEAAGAIDEAVADTYGIHIDAEELFALFRARPEDLKRVSNSVALDLRSLVEDHISYIFGCILGRWDIRLATGEREATFDVDPLAPLPACAPGMLTGGDGLPARDVPLDYPLSISWDGILVDDPGHPHDIVGRLIEALDAIWGEHAEATYGEVIQILAVGEGDLRSWLREHFFEEHIGRYSKSHRQAPIYWRIAPPSGRYALWLYYHRFSRDTLYRALNDYVDPKVRHEERQLDTLRAIAGDNPTASQRREIQAQEGFIDELRTFRDEIARIAPLWNPDLNDGVIINYAPLWRVTPRPRAWQKECQETWEALAVGKFDWAHLAMHLWPERVVRKCETDRSLAIAHDLDDALWVEGSDGKWRPRVITDATREGLIAERSSPAVRDALAQLRGLPVAAPPRRAAPKPERPAASGRRGRKGQGATQLPMALEEGLR